MVEKFQKQVYAMLAAAQQPPPDTDRNPLGDISLSHADNTANTTKVATATTGSTDGENKENVQGTTGDSEVRNEWGLVSLYT